MSGKVWCILAVAVTMTMTTTTGGAVRETRQASNCEDGEECVFLSTCRPFQDLVASRRPGVEKTIREAICGKSNGRDLRVCCPERGSPTHTFPGSGNQSGGNGEELVPKDCGRSGGFRVVFGKDAPLFAYPWMAVLGYQNRANPSWQCGGVLINDRYVLTAAHCVHRNFTEAVGQGPVVTVRLGEHNTATDPDCLPTDASSCAPSHQDFLPQQVTIHSSFNKRAPVSDDIALIRLDRKVNLGISVHPVCLPTEGMDVEAFLESRDAVVAGWGATENSSSSDVLQAAQVPFASKAACEHHYPNQLVNEQVCFGGRGRVDSCFGDSGGPVFQAGTRTPVFTTLGIVSRGLRICGTPGAPAVYTNVAFYRQWIVDNLKP